MGHGHVVPNRDGSKARCGGPGICDECSREQASLGVTVTPEHKEALKRSMLIRFDVLELIDLLTCIIPLNEAGKYKDKPLVELEKKVRSCLGELSYDLPPTPKDGAK